MKETKKLRVKLYFVVMYFSSDCIDPISLLSEYVCVIESVDYK